ncbi:MAG: hypothetical protein A3G93_03485 [Nitrospinae bacterium RIFCSPLOWO2_12_FULL_45_22]|nr:MAG: hypothetical protein A3G93_03485 [Nitrospinae bacterium RIFCSPLOWO2_12_FULL_45_22]
MKRYIRVKTLSPLSISSMRDEGNINRTLDYIPGTVLRGYLANRYIRDKKLSNPEVDIDFMSLFNGNSVRFGNLYPEGDSPMGIMIKILPATSRTCKASKGFEKQRQGIRRNHGIKDFLIEFLRYEYTGEMEDECPECGAPMEAIGGFYCQVGDHFETITAKKREIAHNEISDLLQTSKPGILYSKEAIEKGQYFIGPVIMPDTQLDSYLKRGEKFYLGTGRTRGMGLVELEEISEEDSFPPEDSVSDRLKKLNRAIRNAGIEKRFYFTLNLQSDVIIMNDYFQYLSYIDHDELYKRFKHNILKRFSLKLFYTGSRVLSGWNAAWRLPKDNEIVIPKGSVFLFESNNTLTDNEIDELTGVLEKIEKEGIGFKKNEGFGEIISCHPFHYIGTQLW